MAFALPRSLRSRSRAVPSHNVVFLLLISKRFGTSKKTTWAVKLFNSIHQTNKKFTKQQNKPTKSKTFETTHHLLQNRENPRIQPQESFPCSCLPTIVHESSHKFLMSLVFTSTTAQTWGFEPLQTRGLKQPIKNFSISISPRLSSHDKKRRVSKSKPNQNGFSTEGCAMLSRWCSKVFCKF